MSPASTGSLVFDHSHRRARPDEMQTTVLGIAMNAMWGGGEIEQLSTAPAALVEQAQVLLCARGPDGRERTRALELLANCATSPPADGRDGSS